MASRRVLICSAFLLGVYAPVGKAGWGPPPSFEVVAYLQMTKEQREGSVGRHNFSAVALRMPWAYALDQVGRLYVFRVPLAAPRNSRRVPSERDNGLISTSGEMQGDLIDPTAAVDDAGDGGHLVVAGKTLLCTRYRRLDVFSLDDPARPTRVGAAGSSSWLAHPSTATAREGTRLFLLSSKRIDLYDVAAPRAPKHLGSFSGPREVSCACVVGDKLLVGTTRSGRMQQNKLNAGVAVLDVSNPAQIKETKFFDTGWRAPRQLLRAPKNMVLAPGLSLMDLELKSLRTGVAFSPSDDDDQQFAATPTDLPHLFHSVLMNKGERSFLIGPGEVHEIKPPDERLVFSYLPWGLKSFADGCHGDVDGDYAAVVGERAIAVLRIKDGK